MKNEIIYIWASELVPERVNGSALKILAGAGYSFGPAWGGVG
ncbi:MAG TPA: hypothetical protein VIM11_06840 [Tepidisphaeraceae bacterium]